MSRMDNVFNALQRRTQATAKEIAVEFGVPNTTISQLLGRLYWQGRVEREDVGPPRTIEYLYRIKVVAPPVTPSIAPFPVRIAERETERV
jgi:predicted ArsR family transcriptional regulator